MGQKYIHGYDQEEQDRLIDQNKILSPLIHERIDFSKVHHLLEYGCGVGAQMLVCFEKYPNIKITGVDISKDQISQAKINLEAANIPESRYELFTVEHFDHNNAKFDALLITWLLEHVISPLKILKDIKPTLKTNAQIAITEVFNDSLHIDPYSPIVDHFWSTLNKYQASLNGDGNIGPKLGSLLIQAGYNNIKVKAYPILLGRQNLEFRNRFFLYWKGLMYSSSKLLIRQGMITDDDWKKVEKEVELRIANDDASFYYSFIQAFATN